MVKTCLTAEGVKKRLENDDMVEVLKVKRVKRGMPSEPYQVTWKIKDEYRG